MSIKKILVVGGAESYYTPFQFLYRLSVDDKDYMNNPEKYDMVLFTGGADVDPKLYDETSPHQKCMINSQRDYKERDIFKRAVNCGTKMTGICRGLQFLNVMAGGRMLHDLQGHGSQHKMYTHRGSIHVNSLHHQACIPAPGSYVIGWAKNHSVLSSYGNRDEKLGNWPDFVVEAMLFPEINASGVQYHPEMMPTNSHGVLWYEEFIRDLCNFNPSTLVRKYSYKKLNSMEKQPPRIGVDSNQCLVSK